MTNPTEVISVEEMFKEIRLDLKEIRSEQKSLNRKVDKIPLVIQEKIKEHTQDCAKTPIHIKRIYSPTFITAFVLLSAIFGIITPGIGLYVTHQTHGLDIELIKDSVSKHIEQDANG